MPHTPLPVRRPGAPARVLSSLALAAAAAVPTRAQPAVDLPRLSPPASVSQTFGYAAAAVKYSRPAVNGRVIWGGVVPYGIVWRAGANEPTTVEFSTDVRVAGQDLPAGTYALFVLPEPDAWTFILSRNTRTWGAFGYDAKDDALRATVKPEALGMERHKERLEFSFEDVHDGGARLVLHWERRRASLPINAEFLGRAVAAIALGLPAVKADDPYAWLHSARFYRTHGLDRAQAMAWLDNSIAVRPMHGNLWLKAEWLAEDGRFAEATAVGRLARAEAAKDPNLASQLPEMDARMGEWERRR